VTNTAKAAVNSRVLAFVIPNAKTATGWTNRMARTTHAKVLIFTYVHFVYAALNTAEQRRDNNQ